MLFRRKARTDDKPAPLRGTHAALEGYAATMRVEQAASEALALTTASAWDRPAFSEAALHRAPDRETLLGLLEGFAAVGLRAACFTDGALLGEAAPALAQLAARRLPLVLHHLGRPEGEATAFDALTNSGLFFLYAATVQEAADFALIAHRLAESALCPGVCVQDAAATGASLQSLFVPPSSLIKTYLGRSTDAVETPTPAQEILFGPHRRRLPRWLDLDRPLGLGVTHEPYVGFLAQAAGTPFFLDHFGDLADEAFDHFGNLTGRRYERLQGYQLDDADYVVVAEGAVTEPLMEAVDYLRTNEDIRVGVLKINMRRPFAGPRVAALLKGRKGVTVVDRAQPGLTGEGSLFREVRATLERAVENGRMGPERAPYPTYEAYLNPLDRPPLFEAFYGDELVPPFSDLCAVFMNMLPDGLGRRHVFLGVPFRHPGVRLPKVERLQQLIGKGYPGLEERTLPPVLIDAPKNPSSGLFALIAEAEDATFATGKTFVNACQTTFDWRIRTHTNAGSLQSLRPGLFVGAHAPSEDILPSPARAWDAAVVAAPFFWSELHNLNEGGLLITHWNPEQAASQKVALARSLKALSRKNITPFYIDATKIASGLSPNPQHHPLLAMAALMGAFIAKYPHFTEEEQKDIRQKWLTELTSTVEIDRTIIEGLHQALEQGAETIAELPVFDLVEEASIEPEKEAPWTVQAEQQTDGTVYDLGRFWDSTGYLIESGREDQLLADPFLATGTMPARSSVIHDHAPFRDQMPQLLPDKCTACGTCWISCPDSALPVTIQDVETLIETAFSQCKAAGHTLLQLGRMKKHLAPQAHRLFAGSESYETLGALMQDTFDGLLEKMKPAENQCQTLQTEFAHLRAVADAFPLVKTATFFDTPEGAKKDAGLAFSLVVNPDACKACRTCVEVCPEGALVVRPQTQTRLDEARANWRFMRKLPDVTPERIAPFIEEEKPDTLAYHLLNRRAYHAALGGDLTEPGSGKKTVVHLLAGLVEAALRPGIDRFVEQVTDLMAQVEKKIDEKLHDAVQVDDLAALGDKLADLNASNLDPSKLDMAELAPLLKEKGDGGIDRAWLAQMTDLYKHLSALQHAYRDAAHGDGRARMVMGIADSEVTRWARTFPHNPYPFPWICYASDGASGLAEGLYEGVMTQMAEGFKAVRQAQLHLKNKYKPDEHDAFFEQFGRHDFTDEERALCPPVMALTHDTGFLDHLLGRDLPIKVLVIAEANTLVGHEPGETPVRNTALAAVAYEDVFVLQSSIGTPEHLMPGFLEGLRYDGPAVFYVYAPSPSRDAIPSHEVIPQARRAVKSRAFPLFTFNPAATADLFDRFDLSMNPDADADWPQETLDAEEAPDAYAFTFADWAMHEGLLRHHFKPLAQGDGQADAVPLSTYLDLPEKERTGKTPFVLQPGAPPKPLAVSAEMAAMTAWHRNRWRLLQSLPGHRPTLDLPEEAIAAQRHREALRTHALLTQKLLTLGGFTPVSEREKG